MITRIIKFQIKPEQSQSFSDFMHQFKDELISFEGCRHFDVLKDKEDDHTLFLFMIWEDDEKIVQFRKSDLGKLLTTKLELFSKLEPAAWTVETVFDVEEMKQQKSLFD